MPGRVMQMKSGYSRPTPTWSNGCPSCLGSSCLTCRAGRRAASPAARSESVPCVGGSSGLRTRSAESGGACSLWSNQAQPKRTRAQKGDSRARLSYLLRAYSVARRACPVGRAVVKQCNHCFRRSEGSNRRRLIRALGDVHTIPFCRRRRDGGRCLAESEQAS